jgi:hypothetical protein
MPIQTTDNKALVDYFDSNYPKAWYSRFTSPVETAKFELGYQGIKAGLLTPVSWFLDPYRYDYALWKWLRPNEPTMGIKELSALQKQVALTHVEPSAFRAALYHRCQDKLREQAQFKLWISKRMALLEYLLDPPIFGPSSLADVCPAYRLAQMQAQALFCLGDYAKALDTAEEIGRKALIAAGQSAVSVLFDGQIDFQANLMLPASSPTFDFYETAQKMPLRPRRSGSQHPRRLNIW